MTGNFLGLRFVPDGVTLDQLHIENACVCAQYEVQKPEQPPKMFRAEVVATPQVPSYCKDAGGIKRAPLIDTWREQLGELNLDLVDEKL